MAKLRERRGVVAGGPRARPLRDDMRTSSSSTTTTTNNRDNGSGGCEERVIPSSVRADGSVRRERRVRAGYVPQEERGRYAPPGRRRAGAGGEGGGAGAGALAKKGEAGWSERPHPHRLRRQDNDVGEEREKSGQRTSHRNRASDALSSDNERPGRELQKDEDVDRAAASTKSDDAEAVGIDDIVEGLAAKVKIRDDLDAKDSSIGAPDFSNKKKKKKTKKKEACQELEIQKKRDDQRPPHRTEEEDSELRNDRSVGETGRG